MRPKLRATNRSVLQAVEVLELVRHNTFFVDAIAVRSSRDRAEVAGVLRDLIAELREEAAR